MARDFSKTSTNYMTIGVMALGPLFQGAAAISVAAWTNQDTFSNTGGANDNAILDVMITGTGTAGLRLCTDFTSGARSRIAGRSGTGDALQARNCTSPVTTGVWHHQGGVLDIANDTITPYFNGVAENAGAATFGNATYVQGTSTRSDQVGGADFLTAGSSRQVDGRIAEVAAWTMDIGAAGFAMLADGMSPLFVHPEALAFYMPLIGAFSPDLERINRIVGTINGTVAKADHPPIRYPVGVV